MLKERIENKSQSQQGIFVDAFGKPWSRADLEDPGRPGHLRLELVPIEPGTWSAGAFFGLLSPFGRPLKYVEPRPDAQEPRISEAPVALRREVEAAQQEFDTRNAARQQIIDELCRVEDVISETTALAYARRMGEDEAQRKIAESEATRVTLEERLRELDHFHLPPVQTRLSEAGKRVKKWLDSERLRRTQRQ